MVNASTAGWDRIDDYGAVVSRTKQSDGYTVDRVTFNEAQDITGLLSTLSDGACKCPHWGVVLAGRIDVRYADGRADTFAAGDPFYLPAGHTSWSCEAGTEMVQFSPSELLAEVDAAITAAMQASRS